MSIPGESYAKDELNESWWGGATTAATLCLRDRAPNVDPRALLLYNLNFQATHVGYAPYGLPKKQVIRSLRSTRYIHYVAKDIEIIISAFFVLQFPYIEIAIDVATVSKELYPHQVILDE